MTRTHDGQTALVAALITTHWFTRSSGAMRSAAGHAAWLSALVAGLLLSALCLLLTPLLPKGGLWAHCRKHRALRMLPLLQQPGKAERPSDILYEPGCEEVFAAIVPEYLGGILYGALCESRAAEQAARRTAMDSATQNAEEMIADLSLKFNQARQAAITQEITEIVAGS